MKLDEDNTNPLHKPYLGGTALVTRVETALSFIHPEILSLRPGYLRLPARPRLAPYNHYLDDLRWQKPYTLSVQRNK